MKVSRSAAVVVVLSSIVSSSSAFCLPPCSCSSSSLCSQTQAAQSTHSSSSSLAYAPRRQDDESSSRSKKKYSFLRTNHDDATSSSRTDLYYRNLPAADTASGASYGAHDVEDAGHYDDAYYYSYEQTEPKGYQFDLELGVDRIKKDIQDVLTPLDVGYTRSSTATSAKASDHGDETRNVPMGVLVEDEMNLNKIMPTMMYQPMTNHHHPEQTHKTQSPSTFKSKPNYDLTSEIPTAIGYAAALSAAGLANGITLLAKTVSFGLEEGAKLSQEMERVCGNLAVDIRRSGFGGRYEGDGFNVNKREGEHNDQTNAKVNALSSIHSHANPIATESMAQTTEESHRIPRRAFETIQHTAEGIGEILVHHSKELGDKLQVEFQNGSKEVSAWFQIELEKVRDAASDKKQSATSSSSSPSGNGNGKSDGSYSDDDFDPTPVPELIRSLLQSATERMSVSTTTPTPTSTPKSTSMSTEKSKPTKKKKEKIASVPAPLGEYYTPFEVCNILYQHQMDPALDKPAAMRLVLDNKFVPVGRSQLYKIFKQFREGKITEVRQWGRKGRKVQVEVVS